MNELLIDTSVVIALLKDELSAEARDFIRSKRAAISVITACETMRYLRKSGRLKDLEKTKDLLLNYEMLPLTFSVGETAAKSNASRTLSFTDSLLYSTAVENNLTFVTRDEDFKGLKNAVIIR